MKLKYDTNQTFVDITDDIQIPKGDEFRFAHIMVKHTTAAVRVMENDTALKSDMERFLREFAPIDSYYAHDIIQLRDVPPDERKNGFSHLRFLLFNTSELIPIENGKLSLGKWQRVFLVELDPFREREVEVRFI